VVQTLDMYLMRKSSESMEAKCMIVLWNDLIIKLNKLGEDIINLLNIFNYCYFIIF
jgi:hypothetical protein